MTMNDDAVENQRRPLFYDIFHPALLRSAGQQLQRLHNNLSPWLREWGGTTITVIITITIIIVITIHKPSTKFGVPSLKCPRPSYHCYHPTFGSIKRIVQISPIPHWPAPNYPMLMLNIQGIIMICLAALGGLANTALMLLILVRCESPHNLPIFIGYDLHIGCISSQGDDW